MEPPLKRRRLLTSSDPDNELHKKRTRNDMKLKSIFESIFEKYGKDFSDIGDEIDMHTGKIAISHGHLQNMNDEKDPGIEKMWPNKEKGLSSRTDADPRHHLAVIPDSQDFDSSDDDPLGMPEDVAHSKVSSLSQGCAASISKRKGIHPSIPKPSLTEEEPNFLPERILKSSSEGYGGLLELQNGSYIEEAWRAPPLPEDSHLRPGLPSPSPSDREDSDSSPSASPPGVSIWASKEERQRPRRPNFPGAWTENEDELLWHYLTRTDLTFKAICKHFPGRSKQSLQCRWGQLYREFEQVESQIPKRNGWTPDENQLVGQPKVSIDKPRAPIEAESPCDQSAATAHHWHIMRQKPLQTPTKDGPSPSDSHILPIANTAASEHASPTPDFLDQPASTRSTYLMAGPLSPGSTGADVENNPRALGDFQMEQSKPPSDDERGGPRTYFPGTTTADCQGGDETHPLVNESLGPQACLQSRVSLQGIQIDDSTTTPHPLPASTTDAAGEATGLIPGSTSRGRGRPPGKSTTQSRKRKRVSDQDDNHESRPPKPEVVELTASTQTCSQPNGFAESNERHGPDTVQSEDCEASHLGEQNLDGVATPASEVTHSATSTSPSLDQVPEPSTFETISTDMPTREKHRASQGNLTIGRPPGRTEGLHDLTVISSSQQPSKTPSRSKALQPSSNSATNVTCTTSEATDHVCDKATKLETATSESRSRQKITATRITLADQTPSLVANSLQPGPNDAGFWVAFSGSAETIDGSCDHLGQSQAQQFPPRHKGIQQHRNGGQLIDTQPHPKSKLSPHLFEHVRVSPHRSAHTPSVPRCRQLQNPVIQPADWERIRTRVRSQKPGPDGKDASRPITHESPTVLSSQVDLRPAELSPVENLVSSSKRLAERLKREGLGISELLPPGLSCDGSIELTEVKSNKATRVLSPSFPREQSETAAENVTSEKGLAEATTRVTNRSDATSLSAQARIYVQGYPQVDKPQLGLAQEPSRAATGPCHAFLWIEIPSLTPAQLPQGPTSPTEEQNGMAHASSLKSSQGNSDVSVDVPGIEPSNVSGVRQDKICGNSQSDSPQPSTGSPEVSNEQRPISNVVGPIALTDKSMISPEGALLVEGSSSLEGPSSDNRWESPNDDDLDELQLPWGPAFSRNLRKTSHRTSNGNARQLPPRIMVDEMDMSDDELSTPAKFVRDPVEKTPVRSSMTDR
ncbi:MAG: hypothetical protein L6R39_004335 [Caloplaca ligustica]|nr:MAG: hypothetical protein L6R39_004335 [Caloplaca ligustica]